LPPSVAVRAVHPRRHVHLADVPDGVRPLSGSGNYWHVVAGDVRTRASMPPTPRARLRLEDDQPVRADLPVNWCPSCSGWAGWGGGQNPRSRVGETGRGPRHVATNAKVSSESSWGRWRCISLIAHKSPQVQSEGSQSLTPRRLTSRPSSSWPAGRKFSTGSSAAQQLARPWHARPQSAPHDEKCHWTDRRPLRQAR